MINLQETTFKEIIFSSSIFKNNKQTTFLSKDTNISFIYMYV